jgi:hypothetical protein
MRNLALSLLAIVLLACLAPSAEAQWVRRYYQPTWVSPQPVMVAPQPMVVQRPVVVAPAPVVVGPQPVTVFRPPMVMYQPTQVVTTRNRPILGGTVVRTRPGYRRVVW